MVPIALTNPQPGVYVYDMGQNFSGWVDLHVSGPRGAQVQLRFAELLYDTGMINRENIRGAKARDIYILRGDGEEDYHPRFTYHGFRYVEVTGYPGTPSLDSLRGHVVHTAVKTTGSFVASKPLLNQIHKIIRWSDLTNLHSVPTDCDQRDERHGLDGRCADQRRRHDAELRHGGLLYQLPARHARRAGRRRHHDRYGSAPLRQPPCRPRLGHGLSPDLLVPLPAERRPAHPGGELRRAEEIRGVPAQPRPRQCSALSATMATGWRRKRRRARRFPTSTTITTPWCFRRWRRCSAIPPMPRATRSLPAQIKDAFNKEFFDPKTGNYANGTQTANALPLFLDMVPKDHRGAVVGNLVNNILYRPRYAPDHGLHRHPLPDAGADADPATRTWPTTSRRRPLIPVGVTCSRMAPRRSGSSGRIRPDRR